MPPSLPGKEGVPGDGYIPEGAEEAGTLYGPGRARPFKMLRREDGVPRRAGSFGDASPEGPVPGGGNGMSLRPDGSPGKPPGPSGRPEAAGGTTPDGPALPRAESRGTTVFLCLCMRIVVARVPAPARSPALTAGEDAEDDLV